MSDQSATVRVKLNRTIAVAGSYYQPHSSGTLMPRDLALALGLELITGADGGSAGSGEGSGSDDGAKPDQSWTKPAIIAYLQGKGIDHDAAMTKAKLLELIT